MATAIVRGGIGHDRTMKYTHNAAVSAGDVIVSSNGHVLVAVSNYAANAEGLYVFRGRVEFPKEAALAITSGDVCYWVAAAGNANKTLTGNTKIGVAVESAAGADSVVTCELGENR